MDERRSVKHPGITIPRPEIIKGGSHYQNLAREVALESGRPTEALVLGTVMQPSHCQTGRRDHIINPLPSYLYPELSLAGPSGKPESKRLPVRQSLGASLPGAKKMVQLTSLFPLNQSLL